ncbi:hypothetical protein [Mangrovibrevibacter kandeliae]|uniref:hypothetical protein n=1 Tax=Mangrovibrevibacter kandeliae TaxID=2968473 RepID=UPI00211753A2|nr:hypothetical protein [Aurantimonas sp. CSK15Z-1]MCQ8781654.1 hypothetical protein [Aurantimonas sp. CSK15Z-1]
MTKALRTLRILRGASNLKRHLDALSLLAALSAEGVRIYGDDPKRVAAFVDARIAELPPAERARLREQLSLVAGDGGSTPRH